LNIIVGANDAGKSNFIKALHLFFKNETEPGKRFNPDIDIPIQVRGRRGDEKLIEIELKINPPELQSFATKSPIKWKKTWYSGRTEPEEIISYIDPTKGEFKNDSRNSYYKWLKSIQFIYVPAIKSQEYFSSLISELYHVLMDEKDSINENVFNEYIQDKTKIVSEEISQRIGIDSVLQFKGTFKDLFAFLEFGDKEGNVMLAQRGDGIKIRHIPVLLKHIAHRNLYEQKKREPIKSAIWGFEEPENNLEYGSARKLAENFLDLIDKIDSSTNHPNDEGIQIFITTHSPIFYSLPDENDKASAFFCEKDKEKGHTIIKLIPKDKKSEVENAMDIQLLVNLSSSYQGLLAKLSIEKKINDDLHELVNTIKGNKKFLVLTEDKILDNLKMILESSGFKLFDLEFRSYEGCTSIAGAKVLSKYIKDKFPDIVILVHRDRDYLTDKEVLDVEKEFKSLNVEVFITNGTDIESYFISKEHIAQCYPHFSPEKIDTIRNDAVSELLNNYYDLLMKKEHGDKYSNKSIHAEQTYRELVKLERYWHGKLTLRKISAIIQSETKQNAKLERTSNALCIAHLKELSEKLYGQIEQDILPN